MSCTLEALKEDVWSAFAAVRLCKALDAIFTDRRLQTSSPITINIDTTAKLVHGILESEDQAECEKDIPQVKLAIETAHTYWNSRVCESWESLRPELDAVLESRCAHDRVKMCIPCKLQRRIPLYGVLWADFVGPSTAERTAHLEVTELVLDKTLTIMAARGGYAEDGDAYDLTAVSSGDEEVLRQLEKFDEPHPRVTYWRELLQNLIGHNPVVRTRVQSRHAYEAISEPGVAEVDA